jgi:hypothetical protein
MHARSVPSAFVAAVAILVVACSAESPSPSPSASSATSGSPTGQAECNERGPNQPGTYSLTADATLSVPATFTLATDGWAGCGLIVKEFGPPAGPALIGFWSVENVYTDPCHWMGALMDPAVGPTPADLTAALASQELTDSTEPAEGTLGGLPASQVTITVPDDLDTSDCDVVETAEFRFWKEPGEELTGSGVWWIGAKDAPGLVGEVWATDIDGVRAVVQAAHFSDADQAEVDEIHGIVDSITFEH